MAIGLYGHVYDFVPELSPKETILGIIPDGPRMTLALKVHRIGELTKIQTKYGKKDFLTIEFVGHDSSVIIKAEAWSEHSKSCLAALAEGCIISVNFVPKPAPPSLIESNVGFGIRLNTEAKLGNVARP